MDEILIAAFLTVTLQNASNSTFKHFFGFSQGKKICIFVLETVELGHVEHRTKGTG